MDAAPANLRTSSPSGLSSAEAIRKLRDNIQTVFLGQPASVDLLLIGLLARGHVLIEDVPGVGKTVLAKSLARSIDGEFSRIQLTPDLLPADVLGVSIYNSDENRFDFKPGPIFANIVLADEINRTTPRTQSALLEAMAEEQVSVENQTYQLNRPFMVIATQNPFEFEGTDLLPENQLDRFVVKVAVGYPPREAERRILSTRPGQTVLEELQPVLSADDVIALQDAASDVKIEDTMFGYLLDLVDLTRTDERLHLGVSPRGSLALTAAVKARALLQGRDYVVPDDIKAMFVPSCGHRVISKSYLSTGDASEGERVLQEILQSAAVPS
ncbi:MAG: MoxR family ATPase [Planctomycetota bacterium]